jgi:hypothetical protein
MPAYSEHLVAFYDILGFSEFVQSHPGANEVDRLFARITDVASIPELSTTLVGQRYTHFSDTIIRTTPFRSPKGTDNRFGILFHELNSTVHFQMELIWSEMVWIRGAITFGEAFHDDRAIYGPAVIRAYELEKDVAVFPRVIVDPLLLAFFETSSRLHGDQHDPNTERDYVLDHIKCGDDGVWFVDYLRAARVEADYSEQYPEFLARHKRMILRTHTASIVSRF